MPNDALPADRRDEDAQDARERFRLVAHAVSGLIYDFDVATDEVRRTEGLEALTGYRPDDVPASAQWWRGLVHPDDREVVRREFRRCTGDTMVTEYRIRHRDGRWLWVNDRSIIVRDQASRPTRVVGCTIDVTERRHAEEALRLADRRKDEFIATLAHELRNPLAPIMHSVQFLIQRGPQEPELVSARAIIARQVGQMARLLDDLLDVSRITRGRTRLRKQHVSLATIIENAIETSRPHLTIASHALDVHLPPEPAFVHGDPVRLAQVFSNLLNNAAKFTPNGGSIKLVAEWQADMATVRVIDSGIGIPPDALPRVFDTFSQAAPVIERAPGGLGIGLSLARGLVELHGGAIEAHSEGLGHGSEFIVRLPVCASRNDADSAARTDDRGGQRHLDVLVVDDNADAAESLATLLKIGGHEVVTAGDAEDAMTKGAHMQPDLVLLDIGMPGVNGYECAQLMRRETWARDSVLIAVTGWGQRQDRIRSRLAGFDLHMVKPIDIDELLRRAFDVLATRADGKA